MRNAYVITACLCLPLLLGACDAGENPETASTAEAAAAATATPLEPGKTAASFQLQAVVELVQGDAVADAAALEVQINDPKAKLNAVDLDGDGTTDFVEVIETKQGHKTILEFRAIPSGEKDKPADKVGVVIATITLDVEDEAKIVVDGSYSQHIEHDVTIHVYHHEEPVVVEHGAVVVADGCFYHYAFVHHHEPYHGHFHYVVIDAPDVHVHHEVHVKHKKHKGKGKGHGHGHKKGHGGGVVVTW